MWQYVYQGDIQMVNFNVVLVLIQSLPPIPD